MPERSGWRRRLLGLAPLGMLLAVGVAVRLVTRPPDLLVGLVLGAGGALVVGWLLVSTLWPARADRTCPSCGAEALARRDRRRTVGVRCRACGHVDASRSSWTLAEEEGPLEELVLEQRRAGRTRRRSAVDSRRAAH